MLSVASAHIALPINRLRYVTHGAGSAQGAASRRRPLYPRAPASKIATAWCLRLFPAGYGSGRGSVPAKHGPQPASCGLPRPSGNVSAILRPPAPVVSAAPAPAMIWICRGCRPGKASAATRQKNRRTFSMPLRRHFLRPSGKTDKQAGKSKQTPRRRWLVA